VPSALPTEAAPAAFHIGQPAPRLVVPQLGGGTIDLAALRGKPVWVYFMATWCPSCRDEFPLMNRYSLRHADDGLVVLAIDVREDAGIVAPFVASLNGTFPVGLDTDGAMQDEWDALVLPMHFWIDAEGIVRDGAVGGVGPELVIPALSRIMPGVDVTP
jgi:cytochrome c biogenesis protein CcmG, thiol:disulfide interchange protein DsbE